jgi:hypothetical protein
MPCRTRMTQITVDSHKNQIARSACETEKNGKKLLVQPWNFNTTVHAKSLYVEPENDLRIHAKSTKAESEHRRWECLGQENINHGMADNVQDSPCTVLVSLVLRLAEAESICKIVGSFKKLRGSNTFQLSPIRLSDPHCCVPSYSGNDFWSVIYLRLGALATTVLLLFVLRPRRIVLGYDATYPYYLLDRDNQPLLPSR